MPSDFDSRLRTLAEVVVHVGLNLQPGQPLLITDPYDLLGVHPECAGLASVIRATANTEAAILPADPARLRTLVEADDLHGYEALVTDHTRRLRLHLARGGAFLFLTGGAPRLFAGLPAERLARFDAIKWHHLGPIIQSLIRGASQWTLLPAPTSDWAAAASVTLPDLWQTLFAALRIGGSSVGGSLPPDPALSGHKAPPTSDLPPLQDWRLHLAAIAWQRATLNEARHRRLRYTGPGTDLTLDLPRSHRWYTAQRTTNRGVSYVANLPTEEIFTAPHKNSATGTVRVTRPVAHGGAIISGIELEFRAGRVVRARADAGEELLHRLLVTDAGASRLGEVALVPGRDRLAWASRCHHHILLDENAGPHIALGDAYRFCSRAWLPLALNSSLLHLDLPLDAEAELE